MRIPALKYFRSLISTGLVCLAAALVVSSCSKKPQQTILGKWTVEGQSASVEFRKDGTVITSDKGKDTPAKYTFLNDTNVEMEMTAPVGTNKVSVRLTFAVTIKGDKADFAITAPPRPGQPPQTQTMHLNRIK